MDIGSKFSIIPISEFNRVSQEHEVFFWHFVNRNHNDLGCMGGPGIKPLSEVGGKTCISGLNILVEEYNLKVFESIIEDSLPFLFRFNYAGTQLYNPQCGCYGPKFIGFRNGKKIAGTAQEVYCYCLEGITEVIHLTDPTIFTNNG